MIETMIREARAREDQRLNQEDVNSEPVACYTLLGEIAFFLGAEVARSVKRQGGCLAGLPALQLPVNGTKVWLTLDLRDEHSVFIVGTSNGWSSVVPIVHSKKEQTQQLLLLAIGQMAGL